MLIDFIPHIYRYGNFSISSLSIYRIYIVRTDRPDPDPDLMPKIIVSDQGLHCLPLIQEVFLGLTEGSQIDLSIINDKYGKELNHLIILGKYGKSRPKTEYNIYISLKLIYI